MAGRERRSNAGNRMAKLLDDEEEDEFYKTTYGGFEEVHEDRDYMQVYFNVHNLQQELWVSRVKLPRAKGLNSTR